MLPTSLFLVEAEAQPRTPASLTLSESATVVKLEVATSPGVIVELYVGQQQVQLPL